MNIFTINKHECIMLADYASYTGRTIPSVRHLVFIGNRIRKLKHIRVNSTTYIPVSEITGYPHINPGVQHCGTNIYHYVEIDRTIDGDDPIYERRICPICTYSKGFCEARQKAEDEQV